MIERFRNEIGHPKMVTEPEFNGIVNIHFLREDGYDAYVEYDLNTGRGRVAKTIIDEFSEYMTADEIISTVKSMMT